MNKYQSFKTYRVFGDKSILPDHLNRTDLQINHPFIMVSKMGMVFSPDLSEQYFDYGHDDDTPRFLQLSQSDLDKYFVPANVTTFYKHHLVEWRILNDQIMFHGGLDNIKKRLQNNLVLDRITLQTLENSYDCFMRDYFAPKDTK